MRKHIKNGFVFAGVIGFPLLYLYNLLVIYTYQRTMLLPSAVITLGILMAVIGVVLWAVSMATLGGKFGVLPQKHKKVTHGVYSYLKHPMYVGIWLTFTGLSLACQSWVGLVFTTVIMIPILVIRAYFEEKKLE